MAQPSKIEVTFSRDSRRLIDRIANALEEQNRRDAHDRAKVNSAEESSNLVEHARREMTAINEDPEMIEGLLKVVRAFAEMGHSGGSASIAIPMLNDLLQFKNLAPLTDNPDEWFWHDEETWGEPGGVWQNKRNGEAFSHDGGKTYYLLSEGANVENREPLHTSRKYEG